MTIDTLWESLEEAPHPGDTAWEHVRELHARDRWSTTPRYNESSAWCAETLRRADLEGVERVPFPADGRTKFGDWMMPLAWDVERATLEVAGPEARLVADYGTHPQSLVMWSAPTPGDGVEGEVLVLEQGTPGEVEGRDVRGRILLTPRHPTEIKAAAARGGALGIVSDWLRAPDAIRTLPDERQWINTWSDAAGGWAMHASDSRLWGFMLSPREGERLRREAACRNGLRARALVAGRLYEGELHTVTGAIRGTTDEEVLLMAHINEQGANDNAAGAAAVLEAARLLARLVTSGVLPRPRRTLRVLLMPESYGTIVYAVREGERLRRTIAALNVDSGAGEYGHPDSILEQYLNPHCCPNFVDAVLAGVIRRYYERQGRPDGWKLRRYTLAGDNFFCDPLLGVPHPWIAMGDGGDYWHNTGDIPSRVDPRSLRDLIMVVAGFAWFMAQADAGEIEAFARASKDGLPGSLQPLLRFPGEAGPATETLASGGLVPVRSCPGALTLDGIAPERWATVSGSPRWWGPKLAAWWWADGTRSLGEIAARVEEEWGSVPADLTRFFTWLAELGYLELRKP